MAVLSTQRRKPFFRVIFTLICFVIIVLFFGLEPSDDNVPYKQRGFSHEKFSNLGMGEGQCLRTFPGLTKEIDLSVARLGENGFELEKSSDDTSGLVEGRIKNNKLYIISAERRPNRDMLFERQAVLHSLHRAILTSPTPLPDAVFALSIIDSPRQNAWSFSRSNDPKIQGNYWLMPHFAFWSWPKRFIGTIDEALSKIAVVEKDMNWHSKIEKAVWRGTVWFNSLGNTQLRLKLIQATKGRDWADVQDMKWVTNGVDAENAISIEDFCKYKYIIYTEGVTYSGRLPFHQACRSIILTSPPTYLMHTTHLMRPLYSHSLPFSPSYTSSLKPSPNPRWLNSYTPENANVIFVQPDWSDLEQTIEWLRKHDDVARGIAERQRNLHVGEGGIISEAAETCYWRALIRRWAGVVREKNGTHLDSDREGDERQWGDGMRWESFVLTGATDWARVV
ncbi:hypothetical protein HYALB_00010865 [Hymenoscyphus albidus]|uniref:Glycosyl transferase CAP10 domain-containing protein n=1 Tax=Hymenoscyphus albidus TaxID=595503 RepID=A0A9N9LM10_9HELO|nr:hypothetical protein HYALB_00010865 [Hymenoscyphus albidus]